MLKKLDILFEDDFLLAVNKPAGTLSQKSLDPKRHTVEDLLLKQRPELKVFLHHRLDKETTGVFLFSKSKDINSNLTNMFRNHHFTKIYWCLSSPHKLMINNKVKPIKAGPLVHNEDHWIIRNYMAPSKGLSNSNSKSKITRMISVNSGGLPAETEFRTLKKFSSYYLIEAKPKTGRTHQIRQHLQESDRSLIGDELYGGVPDSLFPRFMLHAYELEFEHPKKKEPLIIRAPLPEDFKKLISPQGD